MGHQAFHVGSKMPGGNPGIHQRLFTHCCLYRLISLEPHAPKQEPDIAV